MSNFELASIVISVLLTHRLIAAVDSGSGCDTNRFNNTNCTLPYAVLQIISPNIPVNFMVQDPTMIVRRWCVSGQGVLNPDLFKDSFTTSDNNNALTYNQPNVSDAADGGTLYASSVDCCGQPSAAIQIISEEGNFIAKYILLHVDRETSSTLCTVGTALPSLSTEVSPSTTSNVHTTQGELSLSTDVSPSTTSNVHTTQGSTMSSSTNIRPETSSVLCDTVTTTLAMTTVLTVTSTSTVVRTTNCLTNTPTPTTTYCTPTTTLSSTPTTASSTPTPPTATAAGQGALVPSVSLGGVLVITLALYAITTIILVLRIKYYKIKYLSVKAKQPLDIEKVTTPTIVNEHYQLSHLHDQSGQHEEPELDNKE